MLMKCVTSIFAIVHKNATSNLNFNAKRDWNIHDATKAISFYFGSFFFVLLVLVASTLLFSCCYLPKGGKRASQCSTLLLNDVLHINRRFMHVMMPLPPPHRYCDFELARWQATNTTFVLKSTLSTHTERGIALTWCICVWFTWILWNTIAQFHGQISLNVLFICCCAIVAGDGN